MTWSLSGWQSLTINDVPTFPIPKTTSHVSPSSTLLDECPLIVPVLCAGWNHRTSLDDLWHEIHTRLNADIRDYLPRGRVYTVNGKSHVRAAYHTLDALFRQHLIRFRPLLQDSTELLLLTATPAEQLDNAVRILQPLSRSIEVYPSRGDTSVLRLAGDHRLLDAIMHCPVSAKGSGVRAFFIKKEQRVDTVRFAYELLYQPRTQSWMFSPHAILRYMQEDA